MCIHGFVKFMQNLCSDFGGAATHPRWDCGWGTTEEAPYVLFPDKFAS